MRYCLVLVRLVQNRQNFMQRQNLNSIELYRIGYLCPTMIDFY